MIAEISLDVSSILNAFLKLNAKWRNIPISILNMGKDCISLFKLQVKVCENVKCSKIVNI